MPTNIACASCAANDRRVSACTSHGARCMEQRLQVRMYATSVAFRGDVLVADGCPARPTSAPGLGSPPPHLRRDWAHPRHICARFAPGLGPPLPTSEPGTGPTPCLHLSWDWARPSFAHLHRDCLGSPRPTFAPGLTGLAPPTSAPGLCRFDNRVLCMRFGELDRTCRRRGGRAPPEQ